MSAGPQAEPPAHESPPVPVLDVVRRGWRASPELREGIGLTSVLAAVGAAGRIVVPVAIRVAVDRGLGGATTGAGLRGGPLLALCLVTTAVVLVTALAARWSVARLGTAGERALYGLRVRAFEHVHRLSIADQGEERRGALVARTTSDVETLSQFFAWGGMAWVVNTLVMTAVLVTMVVFDWRLALVTVVLSVPVVAVLRGIQRRLVAAYAVARQRVAELLTALAEVVMGAAVVRAYGLEQRTTERVRRAIDAERRASVRAAGITALLFPTGDLFAAVTIVGVVGVGLAIGPGGGLTAGELVAFVFLVNRFLEPVAQFTETLDQTQRAAAGWHRVLDLLDTPVEVPDPGPAGVVLDHRPPSIEAVGVGFTYRPRPGDEGGSAPALTGVSFTVEAGTSVAIVGETGSGKTTLARLLTRLADPTVGTVLVDGVDLRRVRFSSLRRTLVLVPQEPFLFDTTVAENVRFGHRSASDADVRLAFVELGLADWLDGLPLGQDTPVGERGEHLSAGERQLVALARAYVANPVCLVLDEATSSVDPATEARMAVALDSLARGRTSVTIAHRLSTAARADRILVMDRGRLVEQGGHEELVARGGVYARLWESWIDATTVA